MTNIDSGMPLTTAGSTLRAMQMCARLISIGANTKWVNDLGK